MTQINNTLLSRLFLDPNPQPKNKEVISYFKEIHHRMFPNSDDYIEFLKAQSVDRQYESAERIIHRLCYHANFPPSYYALLDIICVENYQEKGILDTDTYVPRDHFIHIVYLYLLGIYVFFYNTEFYTKIIASNKFERNGFILANVKYDCIKDFISEWKYFCLYHDIGYSAEILGNENKFRNRKKVQSELKKIPNEYKASLGQNAILKQTSYWGTLEILSKLLFTKLVISNSSENIFPDHKIYRIFKQQSLIRCCTKTSISKNIKFNEIPQEFLSGIQLEKIYSNHCFKKILSSIDLNDVIIIGLEKESGYVGFVTFLQEGSRIYVYREGMERDSEFNRLLEMPDIITFDDYSPKTFEFVYLLRNANIEDRISSIVSEDFFDSVYYQTKNIFESDFKSISDEANFIDFPYTIYCWLHKKVKTRLVNTKLEAYLDNQKFSFESKSKPEIIEDLLKRNRLIRQRILESLDEYHYVLSRECNELLRQRIEKEIPKPNKNTSPDEMLSSYIEQYFQVLLDIAKNDSTKELIRNDLSNKILSQIEDEVSLLQLFSQVFVQVKSTLDKSDVWFEYNYITGETKTTPFLEASISKKLQDKMMIPDIATVCKEYNLYHGNTVDHGIISAQYAASVFLCYRNALLKAHNVQEQLLLSVLLDIPNEIEQSHVRYIINYNHVFTNVLYAVFTHNLYPSHFDKNSKGAEYKTNMSDPFTYLSLLCDALQEWNRPRSLHPSLFENHPLKGASEEYNIDVKDNCIFLSDTDVSNNGWIDNNITTLKTYLANIDAFVKHRINPF